jgi:hypothetical protein
MKIIRYITASICVALALVSIYYIDYNHFLSEANVPLFVVVVVMILNILALMWPGKVRKSRQNR